MNVIDVNKRRLFDKHRVNVQWVEVKGIPTLGFNPYAYHRIDIQ
jgi:hypothetical protein